MPDFLPVPGFVSQRRKIDFQIIAPTCLKSIEQIRSPAQHGTFPQCRFQIRFIGKTTHQGFSKICFVPLITFRHRNVKELLGYTFVYQIDIGKTTIPG